MIIHFLKLLFRKSTYTTQLDSWWLLNVPDRFHYQLYLNSKRLVFLLIHHFLIHDIDENLLTFFQRLQNFFLRYLFLFLLSIQIFSGLFLSHPFQLFLKLVFLLSPTNLMSLLSQLWIIQILFQLLYFLKLFLVPCFLICYVLLISDELINPFFK